MIYLIKNENFSNTRSALPRFDFIRNIIAYIKFINFLSLKVKKCLKEFKTYMEKKIGEKKFIRKYSFDWAVSHGVNQFLIWSLFQSLFIKFNLS